MTAARTLAIASLLVGGCGRLWHQPQDAGLASQDAPGLDAPGLDAPGLDAPGLDAPGLVAFRHDTGAVDIMADAYADDAFDPSADAHDDDAHADDAFVPGIDAYADDAYDPGPDAYTNDAYLGPGTTLLVTNTLSSGAGSLEQAMTTLAGCASPPYTVRFAVSRGDSGYDAGRGVWRFTSLTTISITCPGTTIDGTTQTDAIGDDNTFVVNVSAGTSGVPVPTIEGPEIDLRRITLRINAPDVTIRGVALQALSASAPRARIEQCFLGSEPHAAMPQPAGDRISELGLGGYAFYAATCPDCVVASSVIAGAPDMLGQSYNLFSFRTGSARATLRDSYVVGGISPGTSWDILYLVEGEDHRILHNRFEATGYEVAVEWVPGYGGEVSENTFVGYPTIEAAVRGVTGVIRDNFTLP